LMKKKSRRKKVSASAGYQMQLKHRQMSRKVSSLSNNCLRKMRRLKDKITKQWLTHSLSMRGKGKSASRESSKMRPQI